MKTKLFTLLTTLTTLMTPSLALAHAGHENHSFFLVYFTQSLGLTTY
ncbi:hypothetical protein L0B53_12355 [Vibrio sp. SS-MA-C1-2]|nr:hypothetical protein [Vibrio sp. SS-MA-C1-2]UJF17818.1 hypothetical protein L0B53_12355 [Vibrio sp. SS-MA-C1-2]